MHSMFCIIESIRNRSWAINWCILTYCLLIINLRPFCWGFSVLDLYHPKRTNPKFQNNKTQSFPFLSMITGTDAFFTCASFCLVNRFRTYHYPHRNATIYSEYIESKSDISSKIWLLLPENYISQILTKKGKRKLGRDVYLNKVGKNRIMSAWLLYAVN